jgi:signal peptidase I
MQNSYLLDVIQAVSDPSSEGEFRLKVTGTSMSPFLKQEDRVFVQREALKNLAIGDVLVILRDNDFVTHRLVRIDRDQYYCKGDNTHIPDPAVSGEQVFGKVTAVERAGNRLSLNDEGWKTRNKILGQLGAFENQLYLMADRMRNWVSKNPENKTHIFIGRIVFLPFRAIMRLISR